MFDFTFIGMVNIMTKVWRAKNVVTKYLTAHLYGRKSADRTEHGNDVIFLIFLATVFGNLEVWKVRK